MEEVLNPYGEYMVVRKLNNDEFKTELKMSSEKLSQFKVINRGINKRFKEDETLIIDQECGINLTYKNIEYKLIKPNEIIAYLCKELF